VDRVDLLAARKRAALAPRKVSLMFRLVRAHVLLLVSTRCCG
jgi:hypothetical protein